jgi:hypothetical protein
MGEAFTRHSLRPLHREGHCFARLGQNRAAGMRTLAHAIRIILSCRESNNECAASYTHTTSCRITNGASSVCTSLATASRVSSGTCTSVTVAMLP